MGLALQLCSYLLWFPLEILAISAVLRADVRRHPLVTGYLVVTFLGAVAQLPALWTYYEGRRSPINAYVHLYWLEELVSDALILAIVITLIYRASSGVNVRRTLRRFLALGSVAYIGISFVIHYEPAFLLPAIRVLTHIGISIPYQHPVAIGLWMAPWTRDITFCAAILDLSLWAILIGSHSTNSHLLTLSGGMGIMFCCLAIGESFRTMAIPYRSHPMVVAGNSIEQIGNLIFLYVWWQTFRREAAERALPFAAKPAVLPD